MPTPDSRDLRTAIIQALQDLPILVGEINRRDFLEDTHCGDLIHHIPDSLSLHAFLSELLRLISQGGSGKERLVAFLDSLAFEDTVQIGRDHKRKFAALSQETEGLSPGQFSQAFQRTGLSTAQLIERCLAATRKERTVVGSKYIPELYMPLAEIENNFRQFLDRPDTCFLIVAKAGRGKTNLVCHLADTYQEDRPLLFLSGRYQEPDDEQDILRYIAMRLDYPDTDWQACFNDLGRAASSGTPPLILVDGINESPAKPGKMLAALRELIIQANQRSIKVCITCRTDFWQFFRADFWRSYVWQEDHQERDVIRGKDIALFGEEIFEEVRLNYFRYFKIEGDLIEEARERCRNPLLLRFFCEAYDGRSSNGRKVGQVAEIRLYPLFARFWRQKLGNVRERLGDQLAAEAVSDFILTIAGLMRRSHRTTISRREVADALNTELRTMLASDSIYVRTLDEEIIIEEETNPLTSSANVFFVYDKFSEFAISLNIYQSQEWHGKTALQITADTRSLMKEEAESEFATLRGALEFLVWQLEEQRANEEIHFQMIDSMLEQDWKWRRIGVMLAFQLLHPENDNFWQYINRLTVDQREFVRRMCAGQLPILARNFPDRAVPLIFHYLGDSSRIVQQAARASLRSLDANAAINAARQLLSETMKDDEKQNLVSEMMLFPYDSLSLPLQSKARWLVKENTDRQLQDILLDHFTTWDNTILDLFKLEELERLFQVDWTREQKPGNVYLDALQNELAPRRAELDADIYRLQKLLDTLNDMGAVLAEYLQLRPSQAIKNLDLPLKRLVSPSSYESFLGQIGAQFGITINLPNGSGRQKRKRLEVVTPAWLAVAIATEDFLPGEEPNISIDQLDEYEAEDMLEVYQTARGLLDRAALLSGKSRSMVHLSTPFGKEGLGLETNKLGQLFAEYTEEFNVDLPATVRRSLTNLGRLLFWFDEARAVRQEQEQEIDSRTETLAGMSKQALQQRLAEYEQTALTDVLQKTLEQDIQALLRAFADADLKQLGEIFEPAIQWHHDQDSQVLNQAFTGLFWRERGRIWSLASELLQHRDQRVIDFASQLMEQIEYAQETDIFGNVMDRVRAIIVDILGVDPDSIRPETRFREDLEADSLDLVELIMEFEDEFGGEISDEEAVQITTVGEAAQYLTARSSTTVK